MYVRVAWSRAGMAETARTANVAAYRVSHPTHPRHTRGMIVILETIRTDFGGFQFHLIDVTHLQD